METNTQPLCSWEMLPEEMWVEVLRKLHPPPDPMMEEKYIGEAHLYLCCASMVCRQWRNIVRSFRPIAHVSKIRPHTACKTAAARGKVELLRWLLEELKCPWDELISEYAAAEGHLPLLQWLETQYPYQRWSPMTKWDAKRNKHLYVYNWLLTHKQKGSRKRKRSEKLLLK